MATHCVSKPGAEGNPLITHFYWGTPHSWWVPRGDAKGYRKEAEPGAPAATQSK
jgi:hypothetical protein